MTTILDRIKAANWQDRKNIKAKRGGKSAASLPVLKRIANGTIPPKKTQESHA